MGSIQVIPASTRLTPTADTLNVVSRELRLPKSFYSDHAQLRTLYLGQPGRNHDEIQGVAPGIRRFEQPGPS